MMSMLSGFRSQKRRDNLRGLRGRGAGYKVSTHREPVFTAGIVLSGDVCQLMLIRYGGPNLQMDFVSFVHLMLRAEKMESEPLGRREARASSALPVDCPPVLSWSSGDSSQCRNSRPGSHREHWLRACETWLPLPDLIYTLPLPEESFEAARLS